MFRKLLVPLDRSERAEAILPHVTELARKFGSEVVLLQVVEPFEKVQRETLGMGLPAAGVDLATDVARERVEAEHEAASRYLSGVNEGLQAQAIAGRLEVLEGAPAAAIVRYADTHAVDLIAMSTHGRGGLARLVFGSVADAMLRLASCPLLLIRSEERPEQERRAAVPADQT
jgi:nucleotide-binding universal stress UspA family protein